MTWLPALRSLRRRALQDSGQDLLEYGLLISLIAVVAIAGVGSLGATINAILWEFIANYF